jgi:hypothetical protein
MKNKPLHWEMLENDFKDGRSIVLFLGTGINYGTHDKDFSWDALINHLLQYAISKITHNGEDEIAELLMDSANNLIKKDKYLVEKIGGTTYDILKKQIAFDSLFSRNIKTTIVKQKLGNEMYVSLIRDFLYSQVGIERINKSIDNYVYNIDHNNEKPVEFLSLLNVADLILRNRNIRAIVTQNYDQFLYDVLINLTSNEKYNTIRKNKATIRKITPTIICDWKGQSKFSYDEINIYHVHGYIPRYEEIQTPKDNKIVLSMDEFYEDSRNVYSWQIASQLHFLSQYTCIFCGLSLDDYTNQRLLHYIRGKNHGNLYYLTAGDARRKTTDRIKNEFHERNGLTVLSDEIGYSHLYNLLKDLQYDYKQS